MQNQKPFDNWLARGPLVWWNCPMKIGFVPSINHDSYDQMNYINQWIVSPICMECLVKTTNRLCKWILCCIIIPQKEGEIYQPVNSIIKQIQDSILPLKLPGCTSLPSKDQLENSAGSKLWCHSLPFESKSVGANPPASGHILRKSTAVKSILILNHHPSWVIATWNANLVMAHLWWKLEEDSELLASGPVFQIWRPFPPSHQVLDHVL